MKTIVSTTGRTTSCRRSGFTLVELLLVLSILAILAGIVLPRITRRAEDARQTRAKADIASFVTALSMFEVDTGDYPTGTDGLQALMVRPRDAQVWKGPYLQVDKVPLDPWKHPYIYQRPGKRNPTSYDLYSNGKDGLGGKAAIGNWTGDSNP
jgi:general secretion pathway protein G